jgi:hypothetical protein
LRVELAIVRLDRTLKERNKKCIVVNEEMVRDLGF